MDINHQMVLAARPEGDVKDTDFTLTTAEIPEPGEGQVVVKVDLISIDPAMRSWMNPGASYVPPVDLGAVMRAGGIGTVIASRHPGYAVGDELYGAFGVQEYALSDGTGLHKIDTSIAPKTTYLGALGITGLTAYFGLFDVARIQQGDTVVVSGAGGAVGSMVGQIAKITGCRAIGIAGGPEKCRTLVETIGFDAAIDYKNDDVRKALREYAPGGVDVYFDNVGGPILDAVLTRLARGARVVISGAMSQYNDQRPMGPANYMSLLVNRASMTGMVVFDYEDRYPEATRQLAQWLAEAKLTSAEHVVEGSLGDFPSLLRGMFTGANTGKLILQL
ncbi:Alcohol dehydrogenase zinc-binding domain protein [Streptomyces violaceusniger Tu 4113]|uniref:Alcohol dehydrogenase zinc-binding domain protein n=2 Tax=Streptomyces violaceusniger TaxID=68280 RepID=G2P3M3_STRV4|nr:Alcohol dehydrogenase zinc-binding domain protein [Streptomyces violaceusniger Tu 4113]